VQKGGIVWSDQQGEKCPFVQLKQFSDVGQTIISSNLTNCAAFCFFF
jgi:hypothetical protein